MADEDLRKILGEDSEPIPPAEDKEKTPDSSEEDQKLKAKQEQLDNLTKAIGEAQNNLRTLRKEKKTAAPIEEEEDIPKINLEDPSAKAWDRRIRNTVAPVQAEIDREKEEILTFSLREFLADKPSLAKNPEKLKQVMGTFDRIKTSSGRTREGVLLDLEKAYAAEHYDEFTRARRQNRIEQAKADMIFSDPGVSSGVTTYQDDKPKKVVLSSEEQDIVKRWESAGAPKI